MFSGLSHGPRNSYNAVGVRTGGCNFLAPCGSIITSMSHEVNDLETQVLGQDKEYDNGGAKEASKAIFQLLGRPHPLVERSFGGFSSALHS